MSKDRAAQLVEAGIWLKLSGDREGARKLFERALKLDPGNEKAEQLLAGAPAEAEAQQLLSQSIVPPPPTVSGAAASNPFERSDRSPPLAAETDWGMATGYKANPTPAPSLEGDWGRMTGTLSPPPQPRPTIPGPFASSSSNVVLGSPALAPAEPAAPRATMQLFSPPAPEAPAPRTTLMFTQPTEVAPAAPPAPRKTLQLFTPPAAAVAPEGPVPPPAPAPRTTMQFFTSAAIPPEAPQPPPPAPPAPMPMPVSEQTPLTQDWGQFAPQTIQIGGASEPDAAPPSTPPLFGYQPSGAAQPAMTITLGESMPEDPIAPPPGAALSVTIGGEPGPESPPPSTPPLFSAPAPAVEPAPRTTTDPMGYAWAWSSSSPPPQPAVDAPHEAPPEPRPSPSLSPAAESAWDHRSNPGIKLDSVAGHDRALDLLSSDSKVVKSPEAQKEEIRALLRAARDLLELDDHTGAMELIVKAQTLAPDDPDVLAMRERSERTLLNMFESKLGKLETIPRVLLKDDEIIWLNLDHRAGFVLAQIDGTVSFDDLFSVSGMSRIDTARILAQLVEEGVISRG